MISQKIIELSKNSSAIRAMFEEGRQMAALYGAENVFDFSLGNPSVAAPPAVKEAIIDILDSEDSKLVHGYMSNAGYDDVRSAIAESINSKQGTAFAADNIIMSVGAAGGINVIFKTLLNPGDEVIVFAPFFGEYRCYASNFDAELVVISPDTETFQPNLSELEAKLSERTKAVIVNSPNNPSGVVYSEETIKELARVLERGQARFGSSIYLISDEPYRELVYDGAEVPYLTKYYKNTIVGYSFSKSLSLPGQRIGYLVIPSEVDEYQAIFDGAGTATRILGFVNAPSLFQRVVARCLEEKSDIEAYNINREALYSALTDYGFECVKPQGAFYLFVKSPLPDEKEFCTAAKKYNILIVPGSSFGCPGFVRIAYCVSPDTISGSLPGFKRLAEEYIHNA